MWFPAKYTAYICEYTFTLHTVTGQLTTTELNLFHPHGVNLFPQQKMTKLINLFLADNQLEAVPHIPDNVRILHLQVCIFYWQNMHKLIRRQLTHPNCCISCCVLHLLFKAKILFTVTFSSISSRTTILQRSASTPSAGPMTPTTYDQASVRSVWTATRWCCLSIQIASPVWRYCLSDGTAEEAQTLL